MGWIEKRRERRAGIPKRELLGLPNYLTYARIIAIPFVIATMYMIDDSIIFREGWNRFWSWVSAVLIIIAGLSDIVDGHYARKYKFESSYGKFLDPLADKLMSFAVLIMLVHLQRLAAWVVIILISRDVIITALRGMAADEGLVVAASFWGKKKTAMLISAMVSLTIYYQNWGLNARAIGVVLMTFAVLISVGSAVHYMYKIFSRVILSGEKPPADPLDNF